MRRGSLPLSAAPRRPTVSLAALGARRATLVALVRGLAAFRKQQVGCRALGRFGEVPEAREQPGVDVLPVLRVKQMDTRLLERSRRVLEELSEWERTEA